MTGVGDVGPDLAQEPQEPQALGFGDRERAKDRLGRLLKARADYLQKPVLDDRGQVVIEAVSDRREAEQQAIANLRGYAQNYKANGQDPEAMRAYITGQSPIMPADWQVDEEVLPSKQTLREQGDMRMQEALAKSREENPSRAALYDYVAGPASKFYGGMAQVPVNVAYGVANLFGAQITPPNVRAGVMTGVNKMLGADADYETTRRTMEVMDQSGNAAARILSTGAGLAGEVRSLFGRGFAPATGGGLLGKSLRLAEAPTKIVLKGGGAAGKALFGTGKLGKFAESMGAFGAYSGITAPGEVDPETGKMRGPTRTEMGEAAIHGAIAGAVIHGAGEFARFALRGMFMAPAKALDPQAKSAAAALKTWAKDAGIAPLANETGKTYGNRVIDSWVAAGMPGAPKMTVRKMLHHAARGGIESTGFSLLDEQFRADAYDAAMNGDAEAFERAVVTFAGTGLGLAAAGMRLKDIPGFQRSQPSKPQGPQEPQRQAPPEEMRASAEQFGRDKADVTLPEPTGGIVESEGITGRQVEIEPRRAEFDKATGTTMPRLAPEKPVIDSATGTVMGKDLERLGWEWRRGDEPLPPGEAPKSGETMELPGTDYGFTVGKKGEVTLSPKLAEVLGAEEAVGLVEVTRAVRQASLMSALEAKRLLPGEEISAEGIKAEPSTTEAKPVMRTIRMGEVLESPLQVEPEWKAAKPFPARGKDVIGPEQEAAVEALRTVLNTRMDLAEADRALLSKVIDTMDAVSGRNDQAVAETMEQMPDVLRGMLRGAPEHAGDVIRTTAEMLTTKTPEVATEDLLVRREAEREAALKVQERRDWLGKQAREIKGDVEVEVGPAEAKAARPFFPESTAARQFLTGIRKRAKVKIPASEAAGYVESVAKRPGENKAAVSFAERVVEAAGLPARPPVPEAKPAEDARRERQSGNVLVPNIDKLNAKEAALTLGRSILSAVADNPIINWAARDLATEVMERLPEHGQRMLNVEANTRRNRDQWEPAIAEMGKVANRRNRELEAIKWQEPAESGVQSGYTVAHIAKESALMERFGFDRKNLSERSRRALELWDGLTRSIREKAADLAMHLKNVFTPEGELVAISREAKRDVMTRQPTEVLTDAIMRGEGRIYDAVTEMLMRENGLTQEQVENVYREQMWTEARGVKKLDPIEMKRSFKYFADHLQFPNGEIVKLLETNPFKHAKHMVAGASMRMGLVEEYGQDTKVQRKEGEDGYQDGMPVPYRKEIEALKNPNDQALLATALRAAMGMPTNRLSSSVPVGGGFHKLGTLLSGLNSVLAAAKMTFESPIQNTTEPFATTQALFGPARTGRAYGRVAEMVGSGRVNDLIRERMEAGGFSLHAPEWMLGGEHGFIDRFKQGTTFAKNVLHSLFEFTQQAADATAHIALHEAVDGWRRGESEKGDVAALKSLFGFSEAHAQQVVSGEAPARAYDNIALNGLARITRRGDLPLNKSAFARDRSLTNIFKFTGYFQRQTATFRKNLLNIRDAKTPQEAAQAVGQFSKFMGYNMATFVASQSMLALAKGGWDEFARYWASTYDDIQTPEGAAKLAGGALVGSMFGAAGSAVGGALYALATGDEDEKAAFYDKFLGAIPALGAVAKTSDFADATWKTLQGQPIGEGPYAGKSPLEQLGYYVGSNVSLARAVANGLGGMGITYLGTDPNLENALRASYRWDEKNDMPKHDASADKAFTDAMREAVTRLKAKDGDVDIAEVVADVMAKVPDKREQDIAASFRRRKVFGPEFEALSPELQQSKIRALGEKTVDLLMGYDAALEAAATYLQDQ